MELGRGEDGMNLIKRVIVGLVVFLAFGIASASVQKKSRSLQQNIKQMEQEIPEETISQPVILSQDEVEGRIIENWLRKGGIYNLTVTVEENISQETPPIGEIKGKNLIIKVDVPNGIEKAVLGWVEEIRRGNPMVLVEGVKIIGGEKESTIEVSMIVYGS